MNITILGGLGYVGSRVCQLYQDSQHDITVVDKKFIPERVAGYPANFCFVQADMRNKPKMEDILSDTDLLYLLAAEVEAEESVHKERAVWEHNFEAPKGVIDIASSNTRVVFPSTGNVFGGLREDEKFTGLTEEDQPRPKYPYAEAKREMEKYLLKDGDNFVICRLGTNHGYAPGVRFNLVTNSFTKSAITGETLHVHGAGTNYRPTVSVHDAARGLRFTGESRDTNGEIYHVVEASYRIKNLAEAITSAIETKSDVEHVAKEVPFSGYALDSNKIQKKGFSFQWDLERSVSDMVSRLSALKRGTRIS